jgi:LacI family transcriptional regulator
MDPHITMRELAEQAGCSQTTVSLALRNHPRISTATRERIFEIARKAGYMPDPFVATLMTQLRSGRRIRASEKIGMLTWWDKPGPQNPRGVVLHEGMHRRARQLGYEIEEFWVRAPRMTIDRLGRILHTRSIRGLILGGMLHARGRVSLDWKHFAAAAQGHTILKPGLHHAVHGFSHGMILVLRNLKRLGYTRIGYVNLIEQDDMTNNAWLSAYMGYQYRARPQDTIPPLLTREWDKTKMAEWIERYRIQAVISNMQDVLGMLRELGLRVPGDVGFACLDCLPSIDTCSGVDLMRGEVGAKTVDLVVEQLQNNEFGLPAHPKTVTIASVWCDGDTLHRLRD